MCDASDLAIRAVLGQREERKTYVVYYASKTLNEAQRNYTTTEKELQALSFGQILCLLCWVRHNNIHRSLSFELPTHQEKCQGKTY